MTKYSYAQLEGLWINNGGARVAAPLAAAIAMAESAGDSAAVNHNTNGSTDRGLWQINSTWGALSTFDPAGNAKAAVQISHNGTNFGPWVTFTTGAYKQFMQGSTTPDLSVPGSGSSSSSDGSSAQAGPDCAFSVGGQHIGLIFGHGPSLPSACIIRKTEVRAILGALILVGGGLVLLPGLVIVMAYGFKVAGGGQAAAQVAPYLGPYGRALGTVAKGAGRGAQRGGRVTGRAAGAGGRAVGRGAGAAGRAAGARAARRGESERPPKPPITDPAVEGPEERAPTPARYDYRRRKA